MFGSPRIAREALDRRLAEDRRRKVNECVAWFGEERRRQERRTTAALVDWMARFDAARGAA